MNMTNDETEEEPTEKPDGYTLEWNEDRKPDDLDGTAELGEDE